MSPRTNKDFEAIRETSKENILKTALQLFSSHGYFNTSIRQIAKTAKISTGLLYNYYDSKEELLKSILNQAFELVGDAINTDPSLTPEKRLESTINNFFKIVRTKRKLVLMMTQMGLQATKFDFVNKLIAKKYKHESGRIKSILDEMEIENSDMEAKILMATLDGIMFEVLIMKKTIPIDALEIALIKKYCSLKK